MPTDATIVAKLPMPQGMNTMLPPYALPPNRAPLITNLIPINGELVGRRGWTSLGAGYTTASRYVLSYVACPIGTFASGGPVTHKIVYNYTDATSTRYFIPPKHTYGNLLSQLPTGTSLLSNLSSNQSYFTITPYKGDVKQTEITTSSGTNLSGKVLSPDGVVSGTNYYVQELNGNLLRWGGNVSNVQPTATLTFTLNSTAASYTALSPGSTDLLYSILQDQNATNKFQTYRIESHGVLTSTTGNITLDRPFIGPTAGTFGSQFFSVSDMSGWTTVALSNGAINTYNTTQVYRDRLFCGTLAGYIEWSDVGNFSERTNTNWIRVGLSPINALYEFENKLFIFETNKVWALSGYDEGTFTLTLVGTGIGTVHASSIVNMNGILYFGNADGFWGYSNGQFFELSSEVKNLWQLQYSGNSATQGAGYPAGSTISAAPLHNKYIIISIHNLFELNIPVMYSWLYNTEDRTFVMIGASSASSGVTTGKYLPRFFQTVGSEVTGASATNLNRFDGIIPVIPLGQRLSDTSYTTSTEWILDAHNSGGLGANAFEMIYELHTSGYILNPDGTTRIYEVDLEHSGMYPTNSVATDTTLSVNLYKDTNAPIPWVASSNDQFTTAINASGKLLSYNSTNTSNNSLASRVNFYQRMVDGSYNNFDCRSFMVTFSSNPSLVGTNPTNTFHRFGGLVVRYQPVRQTRVQD